MRRLLLAVSAIVTMLAAPASAQIFGWSAGYGEEKAPVYVPDASQMPPQTALQCYMILAVGIDHKDVMFKHEDVVKPLLPALRARVDAELRRTNQPGDADTVGAPMRRQLLENFNNGMFYDAARACGAAADAGLVKYRMQPGGQEGLNCYAYMANRTPEDPDLAFLEFDIRSALARSKAFHGSIYDAMEGVKTEVGNALKGPQGAQYDANFKDCAPKVRPYVRKIAYGLAPQAVRTRTVIVSDMTAEMDRATVLKIHVNEGAGIPFWDVPAPAWAKLVASADAGNAMICTQDRPLRKGHPAGSLAPVELAEKLLADAGVTSEELPVIIAAAVSDRATFHSADHLTEACAAWGAATAKRYGATYFAGTEIKVN